MTTREFIEVFDTIAEAPEGIDRLRELVIQLAVRGRLVPQDSNDEPATVLLEQIAEEKTRLVREKKINKQKPVPDLDHSTTAVELPSGWIWTCTSALGVVNPRNVAEDNAMASFCPMPVIPTDYRQQVVPETRRWGDIKKGYTHFAEGDVVVAKITPCFQNRKSCVMTGLEGGIGAGTTELHVIRIIAYKVIPEYLLLFYKSPDFLQAGVATMTGTAGQQRVPREYFAFTPLPLPPLAEQRRIISKVDELMGLIDQLEAVHSSRETIRNAGRDAALAEFQNAATPAEVEATWTRIAERMENLFTTPDDLTPLREAVLQLAVRGRLVPQDAGEEPASQLLEQIQLEAKHAPKSRVSIEYEPDSVSDMPCTWESVYIEDAMALVNGRAFKPAEWSTTGIPIVRIQNLNDPSAPYNYCNFSIDEKFYIDTGDLLISWSGTPGTSFGAYIWNRGQAVLNQHIFRCEPRGEAFFIPYLRLAINSRLSKMIERAHGGVGLRHITKGRLQGLRIALPPLAEQHRIVAKVNELMGLIDRLEQHLCDKEEIQSDFAGAVCSFA